MAPRLIRAGSLVNAQEECVNQQELVKFGSGGMSQSQVKRRTLAGPDEL